MSFDLSAFRPAADLSEAGHTFEPLLPGSGVGIGATITVRGPQSAAVVAHNEERYAAARRRDALARKRGRQAEPVSLADVEAALVDLAVAHTAGWSGMVDGGSPVACTPQAARRLYAAHPWLRDQVIAEGQELGNFMPKSLSSSSDTPLPSLS